MRTLERLRLHQEVFAKNSEACLQASAYHTDILE